MGGEERVVVITGAGRGIGRACARAFGRDGDLVAVCDIDRASAEGVADEVRREGGVAIAVVVDVSDPRSVDAAMEDVCERLGDPTVLVNNAARFADLEMRPFWEIPQAEWDDVMAVNVRGAFLCGRAVVVPMRRSGRGAIVNMSSSTIWTGRSGYLHYVTSKAALVGMTRAMASELGPLGIRVNAVTPGATRTEVERSTMPPERWEQVARSTALGRNGVPEDVVGVVRFLASPMARYVTGQVVNVDGGRSFP